jgi:NADH-quinone oxidoreductase subunit N
VAAIEADLLWLAITIVVASAVSAYYYLRVVAVMYFNEPEKVLRKTSTPLLNYGIGIMAAGTLLLGLFSADVIDLADNWTDALTLVNQVARR